MSKDKKKNNGRKTAVVAHFAGKMLKMKNIKEGKYTGNTVSEFFPVLPCSYSTPIPIINSTTSIDAVLMSSYLSVSREKFIPNEKAGFCREYRKKSLILSTFMKSLGQSDTIVEQAIKEAFGILGNFYPEAYKYPELVDKGLLAENFPIINGNYDFHADVEIEPVKGKPGYFKLTKNSNPFPGLSKQMSNYIIDNCAAVIRIMTFRTNENFDNVFVPNTFIERVAFDQKKLVYDAPFPNGPCFDHWTSIRLGNLWSYAGLDDRFIRFRNALDVRRGIFGDIESLLMNIDDERSVLFYFEDIDMKFDKNLRIAFRHKDIPKYISPYFGTPVLIITNPSALYHVSDYGITIDDLVLNNLF